MIRFITAGACALSLASCGAVDAMATDTQVNNEAAAMDSMAKFELGKNI